MTEGRSVRDGGAGQVTAGGTRELTPRAIAAGVVLGILVMTQNVYMGLKLGITEAGSILAAIVSFALFSAARSKLTMLENNIAQSISTAAGSIGIVVSMIPALQLAGYPLSAVQMVVLVVCIALLGLFFAIPLRRQIIVVEQLTFPTGTACATTITAMHAHGDDAGAKARALGLTGLVSGMITWFRDALPAVIPSTTSSGAIMLRGYPLEQLSLGLYWSPLVVGIGLLIGIRAGLSLLLGALVAWGVLGPGLASSGMIDGTGHQAVTHWTMWPAIALMVASGFTSLALKGGVILRSFRSMKGATLGDDGGTEFPLRVWMAGIIVLVIAVVFSMNMILGLPVWLGCLAVVAAFLLASVAIRGYGETDINPVGTMGHANQILAGTLHPGNAITNLGAGGIAAGCSDASASLMQVLKTGHLLGASPKKQILGQIVGVVVGSIVAVAMYLVITSGASIGSEDIPAPGALPWSGMSTLLAKGTEALPAGGGTAVLAGALVGIVITLLERGRAGKFLPSPFGMGIGLVVPGFISVTICLASILGALLGRLLPGWSARYLTLVASGGIAGEAITAVLISILAASGVF